MRCLPHTRSFLIQLACAMTLTGCSSESRDNLWRKLDPAGYKHSHSPSFNGKNAKRSPERSTNTEGDGMALPMPEWKPKAAPDESAAIMPRSLAD